MFWLIIAVLIWGVVHSLTASLKVKEWVHRVTGKRSMHFYRLAYNIFSGLSFMPILWLMLVLPDQDLYRIPLSWAYIFLGGQLLAFVLLIAGVLQTDTLSFIGLRQLYDGNEHPSKLTVSGLYRWVRHPLYTAGLLLMWLTPEMSQNLFIVFFTLTIYIVVGAFFEERRLEREFGQAYVDYKRSTPMLIPGLIFQRNK